MESLVNLNRVSLSCLTLLVYDYLCTFSQEVEYVWTNSLSVGVVLFYLNRYLVFFDQSLLFFFNTVTFVNASTCERLFRSGVWLKAIGSNVASFIIYLQTCALWGNRKAVVIPLFLLQVVRIVSTFVLTHLQWDKVKYLAPREFGGYCVFVGDIGYVRWAYSVLTFLEPLFYISGSI
ncbi:hypothetical protein CC2G_014214 [Coprinopsis cinerea AmutBmut pab1-1]|nr:hypothetical protein CC2G_014214 [Coprinopsis cinerea AmutBmut pab1-1]